MPDALRPPDGWTLYHSIGLLLVGASVIDGDLDPEEVVRIRQRIAAYPGLRDDASQAKRVLAEVVTHYEALRKAGQLLAVLDKHARKVAKGMPPEALRIIADDVVAVVEADGKVLDSEAEYVASVKRHFGL
jgi:tellurite resistance protein